MTKPQEFIDYINNDDIITAASSSSQEPPEILYHYTNSNGLIGIIESNALYASHYLFFNDPSEINYSLEIINEVLDEFIEKETDKNIIEAFNKCRLYNFNKNIHYQGFSYDVYVFCFSKKGDLLSQWRGYANDGKGYSIGINPKNINNIEYGLKYTMKLDTIPPIYLIKIEYNLENQKKIIRESYNKLIEKLKKCLVQYDSLAGTVYNNLPLIITNIQARLSLLFKNPAYKEEEEWRLITFQLVEEHDGLSHLAKIASAECKTRNRNGELVPYIQLGLISDNKKPRIPIKEIIVGPKHNEIRALRALDLFLIQKGYIGREFPMLNKSNIPYT